MEDFTSLIDESNVLGNKMLNSEEDVKTGGHFFFICEASRHFFKLQNVK